MCVPRRKTLHSNPEFGPQLISGAVIVRSWIVLCDRSDEGVVPAVPGDYPPIVVQLIDALPPIIGADNI